MRLREAKNSEWFIHVPEEKHPEPLGAEVRADLFIKKVVILSVAPAEKAAAAVDATELELVLVERVSNSLIDTVIRGSLPTRVIIVKKAERSWREKLRETTAGLANVIVSV